jgi:hypothetical protein
VTRHEGWPIRIGCDDLASRGPHDHRSWLKRVAFGIPTKTGTAGCRRRSYNVGFSASPESTGPGVSVARYLGNGPVAEFCAGLRQVRQTSGRDLTALAQELKISKSQLYAILDGEIKRPPDWDRLVQPFIRGCGGDDKVVADWRRRHGVLVGVHEEVSRQSRRNGRPGSPIWPRKPTPTASSPTPTSSWVTPTRPTPTSARPSTCTARR